MSALVKVDFDTWQALQQLYSDYASAVDSGQWELWPEFFTTDGIYKLQPRENHERGFPLSTLAFDSQAMLRDRVYGIKETLFHDPYCEANYAVFRTKLDGASSVFNVGRYLDIVTQTSTGLKFAQRHCV